MPHYCAKLLVVCLVDDGKPRKRNLCGRSFVILRALNLPTAMERALQAGRKQESRYKNTKGKRVRWAFAGVEELKKLPLDFENTEVGSTLDFVSSKVAVKFSQRFHPRRMNTSFS